MAASTERPSEISSQTPDVEPFLANDFDGRDGPVISDQDDFVNFDRTRFKAGRLTTPRGGVGASAVDFLRAEIRWQLKEDTGESFV